MKRMTLIGLIAAGLLTSGMATALLAQDGPGRGGKGGPPHSRKEHAARQAACVQTDGGTCTNAGPRTTCPERCLRQGQGYRRGLCDGTGPRRTTGACPFENAAPAKK